MTSSSSADRRERVRAVGQDLKRVAGLGLSGWGDLVRALVELAIARVRMGTEESRELLRRAERGDVRPAAEGGGRPEHILVDRVAFAIPRVARRVPWRADCLVQALAAQRWLAGRGVATTLVIGVDKPTPADFEAHAWLMAGDRIVTGGQVARYHAIFKQP